MHELSRVGGRVHAVLRELGEGADAVGHPEAELAHEVGVLAPAANLRDLVRAGPEPRARHLVGEQVAPDGEVTVREEVQAGAAGAQEAQAPLAREETPPRKGGRGRALGAAGRAGAAVPGSGNVVRELDRDVLRGRRLRGVAKVGAEDRAAQAALTSAMMLREQPIAARLPGGAAVLVLDDELPLPLRLTSEQSPSEPGRIGGGHGRERDASLRVPAAELGRGTHDDEPVTGLCVRADDLPRGAVRRGRGAGNSNERLPTNFRVTEVGHHARTIAAFVEPPIGALLPLLAASCVERHKLVLEQHHRVRGDLHGTSPHGGGCGRQRGGVPAHGQALGGPPFAEGRPLADDADLGVCVDVCNYDEGHDGAVSSRLHPHLPLHGHRCSVDSHNRLSIASPA
mmetsp:Transcript_37677/g.111835  ORF Transcript_37677/g.111835 Transcript_37677/m.111835 type:complete len:398 (+) Transcript_37677:355-1548(+)